MIKLGCDDSLPRGWKWVEADSVMDVRDGTHDSPKAVSSGIPLVTSKNLVGGQIDFSTCNFISQEDHAAISKRSFVDNGDILYAMIGTIGNPVIVKKEFEFSIKNVALFKFSKTKDVHNRFIFHFLNSDLAKRQFMSNSRGGTQKFVSLGNIRKLLIPLPPLDEQKRIAEIMDKADAIRRKRQQAIQLADDFLRSVFLDLFGDPVTNPKGWEVTPMSELIRIQGGYAFKSTDFGKSGTPVVKIGNANKVGFTTKGISFIQPTNPQKLKQYELYPGDLLISLTGTVGKDDYANVTEVSNEYEKYYLNQRVAKISILNKTVPSNFIKFYLSQPRVKSEVTKNNRGVRQANIGNADIYSLRVPVPEEQQLLKFDEIVKSVQSFKVKLAGAPKLSIELFDALSQKAFAGEL